MSEKRAIAVVTASGCSCCVQWPQPAAYILGRANKGLLVGRQADERFVFAVVDHLAARPAVDAVVDLPTMMLGTDQVLLRARLDFDDALRAADLERACVEIDTARRAEFPDLDEIFLEPVPRNDPGMRARVLERYGRLES